MQIEERNVTQPDAVICNIVECAVSIANVHKSYGAHQVLRGISLNVGAGDTLGVLGRSGTGKSVLLRLIIGLAAPDEGTISVFGESLAGLSIDRLSKVRKKIGYLFQHAALYDSLTVEENIEFPLLHHASEMSQADRRDRVGQLLSEVGLKVDLSQMPSDISGGMKKRVALARALALNPTLLLLDEPTAGLDPISSAEINDLILALQRDRQMATIVVTHDLFSAKKISNRLALLDQGKVVMEGTYSELEQSSNDFVKTFLRFS